MDLLNGVWESLRMLWLQIAAFFPRLLAGLLLLVAGWLLAKIARRAAIRFLKFVRLDIIAEKSGIEGFLIQGGVRFTTVTIVANLIYWLILLTASLAALNTFGLQNVDQLFNKVILYIPQVVVAVLVLIFGTLFANLIKTVSFAYLNNVGISGASVISKIAQYAILFFVVSVALEQLSIGGAILVSAFQIAFGCLCLALALAFGLGGKEWAAKVLDQAWKKSS
jgi:hypothetical protein